MRYQVTGEHNTVLSNSIYRCRNIWEGGGGGTVILLPLLASCPFDVWAATLTGGIHVKGDIKITLTQCCSQALT